ncbi:sporulation protein YqfC [Clostridium gasigenes]|uniref:Sporulation protein YqfC n=1 Tax=Clostridium gasigenes TaxID=94869 RepID=A0A1H0TWS5_9CLOT|nr:sporulation protein YqfC [Clostridium gasigenes]MBB6624300.1 sporulation protein YqfC [Clostridium gasigenes]MBU3089245.1 sporulation protein YqfC [Clostridium gasigenes]MBU3105240.1 sporulation protein YqfC [Clostridium gasigenes]MBU3132066.1 sporulation protein YqfC [Clostridium gasigenes]MBU3135907.1 sporulation protein YqfC [Clostridium gasigenes]
MEEKLNKSREIIIEKFDLPKDVILDVPKIIVIGDREITIENHKGIIVFERNIIKINSRFGPITINGENFEILYIGSSTTTISGKFKSIAYER